MAIALITGTLICLTFISAISQHFANPYLIFVSIDNSKLYVFKNGVLYKSYPISPGKPSTPTPVGTFRIISKSYWGEGFGGRWMGLNVRHGKYGIHGTIYESYISAHVSKRCVRMRNDDVKELFSYIPLGTTVVISEGAYGEFRNGFRTIFPGDTGEDVMAVQRRLKDLGFYHGDVDGKYGLAMEAAIYQFQKKNKLPITNKITPYLMKKMGFYLFE
ncbi:L,D-transpeptidase family protein [Caldicellulosiruptor naganoensis]|uniref:L,D-transpeptidase family protein n=1 Tax=Caldicellulosiruptor naganoensis TaxID=29324 RepID=A0ABY7BDZ9_9FIRM|nr:L,D-transpeptidase family protein [Caldicellulosiruptor naganoensis]WAM31047.1 L,D-transpeptidase family protein [Caldicellulosiruptor naganoensis]